MWRFRCPKCAECGWMVADEPVLAPQCLRCGHRVEFEPLAKSGFPDTGSAVDDIVVSWLSQPQFQPSPDRSPESDATARCASCGWDGLMPIESPRGDTICPACLAVYRTKPVSVHQLPVPVLRQLIDCPNCARSIEVYESDRGKTIVCSECNYFLGCVLLPERRRFNALPFLNSLLRPAKN
jgi:hypothetical protein